MSGRLIAASASLACCLADAIASLARCRTSSRAREARPSSSAASPSVRRFFAVPPATWLHVRDAARDHGLDGHLAAVVQQQRVELQHDLTGW